jgi:hypothetical protein
MVRPSDFDAVRVRLRYLEAYVQKRLAEGPEKEHVLDEVVNITQQIDRAVKRAQGGDDRRR